MSMIVQPPAPCAGRIEGMPPRPTAEFNPGVRMPTKRKKTTDTAAAQLWRLAQAQTLIESVQAGHEPDYDPVSGKISPTREAIDQVNRENPELVRIFNEEG